MRAFITIVALLGAGCAAVPDSVACTHCACTPAQRNASRPILCSTLQRDAICCTLVLPTS